MVPGSACHTWLELPGRRYPDQFSQLASKDFQSREGEEAQKGKLDLTESHVTGVTYCPVA